MSIDREQNLLSKEAAWRDARIYMAAKFFDEVFLPVVEKGEKITQEGLEEMVANFQKVNPGPGSDFEAGQVWGTAFERVGIMKAQSQTPPPSIEKALGILTALTVEG